MALAAVRPGTFRRALAVLFLFAVAGCSVNGDREGVSVEYPADKYAMGEWAAENHCAKFGRVAEHVKTSASGGKAEVLYMQTRTSIFKCVDP